MIDAVVVGLGRVAVGFQRDPQRVGVHTHAEAWRRHPMTRLVAGVDPDPDRRRDFEADTGAPAYADWDDMLADHAPGIVSVCTPPGAQADCVVRAVRAGAQRVVCEKPCTPDLASSRALLVELGASRHRVGVAFQRRYDPLHQLVAGSSRSGSVRSVAGAYTAGLRNTASHWVDLALAAGVDIVSALAVPAVAGDDPTPSVLLRTDDGAAVLLRAGRVDEYMIFEFDALLANGRVRLLDAGRRGEMTVAAPSDRYSGYQVLTPAPVSLFVGLSNPLLSVADDAVASIEEDRPMLATVEDAVRVHAVVDAVLRSLESGRVEEVL